MMKFFRKHMKELLAVFMALLLVVWLGGSALQNILQDKYSQAEQERGVAFGKKVLFGDMQPAFSDVNILSRIGVAWQMPWIDSLRMLGVNDQRMMQEFVLRIRSEPLDEVEWYMLDAAARHSGIVVPDEALARFKRSHGIRGAILDAVRSQMDASLDRIDQAIRSYVRVLEAVDMANVGIKPSKADVHDFIRQTQEKVEIAAVVVDSAKLVDKSYQPTEDELKAQFEEGKDRDPGARDLTLAGYREPESVQTEYIQISAEVLAKTQEVSDEEAYEYWTAHKEEFLQPAPTTAPATTQTQPAERPPYVTFTEARADVVAKIRDDKAKSEALRLARDLIGRFGRPWAGKTETQPGGASEIPAGADDPELYSQAVEALQKRYPGVCKYTRTLLEDAEAAGAHPGLGRSMAFAGTRQPVGFTQVAFMVSGLEADPKANPDHARLFRNVYETCSEPLVDQQGNVYVFRTLAIRPKQSPASWESVRDKLVEDVRKLKAFEKASEWAKALSDKAKTIGLKAAFEADTALKDKLGDDAYQTPPAFARKRLAMWGGPATLFPSWIPGVGIDEELVETCFKMAADGGAQADRIATSAQAARGNCVVVEVMKLLPVTQEEYDRQYPMAFGYVSSEMGLAFFRNWFDSDQIRTRIGWQDAVPVKKADSADEQPAEEAGEEKPADQG